MLTVPSLPVAPVASCTDSVDAQWYDGGQIIKTVTSMLDNIIRIATRQSPLALWQAHYVQQRLIATHPGLQVELVPMVTRGDIILDTPLAKVGGKGLFVKELEQALLEERADIAVHSMKDVPVSFPLGLGVTTVSVMIRAMHWYPIASLRSINCRRAALSVLPACAVSASYENVGQT